MVVRLWVPAIHRLVARNRKSAISGCCFTASSVAKRAAVSTPLRVAVLVRSVLLGAGRWPWTGVRRPSAGGCRRESVCSGRGRATARYGRQVGQGGCLAVDGLAQPALELDELVARREGAQGDGQVEGLADECVTLVV